MVEGEIEKINVAEGNQVSVLGKTTIVHPASQADPNDTDLDTDDENDQNKLPPRLRLIKATDVSPAFKDPYSNSITHIGTSGDKVTVIDDLSHLKYLKQLTLRSNLVRNIEGLLNVTSLVVLELYENRIKSIKGLENLVNLEVLDLSYNRIRYLEAEVLCNFPKLKKLYVAQNKLSKIEGLTKLTELEMLDLGMNRIEKIEGLENCINLKELWLGKNKIRFIENLRQLKNLKIIDIQSNRLAKLTYNDEDMKYKHSDIPDSILEREKVRKKRIQFLKEQKKNSHGHSHGDSACKHDHEAVNKSENTPKDIVDVTIKEKFEAQHKENEKSDEVLEEIREFDWLLNLEEVFLSHQGITNITGLEQLKKVVILDLSANEISDLSPFKNYKFDVLEDLWLGENKIEHFKEVEYLQHLTLLDALYLEHNPIAKVSDYRNKIKEIIQNIKQIDATRC